MSTAAEGTRALMGPLSNIPELAEMEANEEKKKKKGPYHRKTRQEVVDEKVERFFESYKLMQEMEKK